MPAASPTEAEDRDSNSNASTPRNYAADQVEWLRSRGGYVADELEFRRLDVDDPESPFGMFTSGDIPAGRTVIRIPPDSLLGTGDELRTDDTCLTVANLARQRKLGNNSEYEPYVSYLYEGFSVSGVPSAWSEPAQDLLDDIIGIELPTAGTMTTMSFRRFCPDTDATMHGITVTEEELEEAYLIWLPRAWEEFMCPVFDMINHRNGHWRNIDSTSPRSARSSGSREEEEEKEDGQGGGAALKVYATRDIRAGEQLYLSYNNCTDSSYELSQVTQHILRDFGFVEQYPRRWLFHPDEKDVVFEVDVKEGTADGELQVNWLSGNPKSEVNLRYFRGHLRRLKEMEGYVLDAVKDLASDHERETILEFYRAKMTALQHGIWYIEDAQEKALAKRMAEAAEAEGEGGNAVDEYDDLESDEVEFVQVSQYVCDVDREWGRYGKYRWMNEMDSHFQSFKFDRRYSDDMTKVVDTCLHINGRLHACSSLRPHYHEMLIQYPARYLDESPKRVLYMGGGDNLVLAEVLKFPSLELVVGLELDQKIVRASFNYLRSQPHFNDERVQWWFGDAAKSFLMLPNDYYGSFDLVIVDLESNVIDAIRVADDLNIMDAALLLLAPHGVVARNVDYGFDNSHRSPKYTFDVHNVDIPMFCYLGLQIGSNSIDMLEKTPKDHNTENLYLPPVDSIENPFGMWYNYRTNATNMLQMDSCCAGFLASRSGDSGVMMILEAEDALVAAKSATAVQESVGRALKDAGLTEISSRSSVSDDDKNGWNGSLVFILEEGYVVARIWSEFNYVAFDIHLWNKFDGLDVLKTKLVDAVGSKVDGKASSSYRIVASGMIFGENKESSRTGCPCATESEADMINDASSSLVNLTASDALISEGLTLIQESKPVVAVLCGEGDGSCTALEVLKIKDLMVEVVWACHNISDGDDGEGALQRMATCTSDTMRTLSEAVEKHGKIGGIVIAPEAPRTMGQVLLKVLEEGKSRRRLLTENVVVLETSSSESPEAAWRRVLLDRFRTDFVKFEPAYSARVRFRDSSSSTELGIFSAGDPLFFSHVADLRATVKEKTGLTSEVSTIANGRNNYVAGMLNRFFSFPVLLRLTLSAIGVEACSLVTSFVSFSKDFSPPVATHDDYDHSDADYQFNSQKPLGRQTVIQFEIGDATTDDSLSIDEMKKDLKQSFQEALHSTNDRLMAAANVHGYSVGTGCVIVALWPSGTAVLVWNGKSRVDANLFTLTQDASLHAHFEKLFASEHDLTVLARDEQPRGIGRVVNFQDDIDRPHGYAFDYDDEEEEEDVEEEYESWEDDEEDEEWEEGEDDEEWEEEEEDEEWEEEDYDQEADDGSEEDEEQDSYRQDEL